VGVRELGAAGLVERLTTRVAAFKALARWVLLLLLLVEIGVLSLAWNGLAWVLHRVLPARRGTVIGRVAIGHIYATLWRTAQALGMMQIDTGGLDALADEPKGLIIAANHPTMFDALIMVSRLPRGVCIMKAELMSNPFVGPGARLARYICNDSPRGVVRYAVRCLQEGGQLVLFPEARAPCIRRSTRFAPASASSPARGACRSRPSSSKPIHRTCAKGWPIWKRRPVEVRVASAAGAAIRTREDCDDLALKLERYFRRQLAA
jgi:hypothetical protein